MLHLHAAQQGHLFRVEVSQAAQALQVAFGHLAPALATLGGLAGVGAVEDRVGRRGRGGEIACVEGSVWACWIGIWPIWDLLCFGRVGLGSTGGHRVLRIQRE